MKIKKFLWMAIALPLALSLAACGGDDDNKPDDPTNLDEKEVFDPLTENDRSAFNVDEAYVPSASAIYGNWAGEYEGYDAVQDANTQIKRILILNSNGTYRNVVQGVIKKSGKNGYVDFEREMGQFTYRNGVITYVVQSDSCLNYDTQKFVGYTQKKYYDSMKATYTENATFTQPVNGKRTWVTQDTYLQSLTSLRINLTFTMDTFNGDTPPAQN